VRHKHLEDAMVTETRETESTANGVTLLLAFELAAKKWVLGLMRSDGGTVRRRQVVAGDTARVRREIADAKARWGLPADAAVHSCYEAGRDGFWLHRWLEAHGVQNRVVDSSSIEVPRRMRRVKTDALDLDGLLRLLRRHVSGERRVWSVVRVPSGAAEDARQLERELEAVTADRTRVRNRVRGLLVAQGVRVALDRHLPDRLATLTTGLGTTLPAGLTARLTRECAALVAIEARLRTLRRLQRQAVQPDTPCARLLRVRGIGLTGASRLSREVFDWRRFTSGRQVGAVVGLAPTPYDSGQRRREQGISKAGNGRVRGLAIELALCWRQFQPQSALTQWYAARFGHGSVRQRRIGVVALARKLLIALWRYVETGVVPAGARLKATA
jgi:transposase